MAIHGNTEVEWPPAGNTLPLATFAGGCFWSVELAFQRQPGVAETCVGYANGKVCSGKTGHAEAVQLTYNPQEVTFSQLCELFFARHDPTTLNRQKNDVGTQYRSGIYYTDDEQRQVAEQWKAKIPGCVTEILALDSFWAAESDHQQYLAKGGRNGRAQSAAKFCTDPIRCYG